MKKNFDTDKQTKIINSKALLENRSLVYIEHEGQMYTLRMTKERKLLLTK
ncbi:hypothetical protein Dacet_1606 [Denitrovibrio acetiphilus DSM 12809]|uniref:Hemin uptake protein hemP n=1 Tax=Denitrovibrio acetiphilus (strain DSM 12809 / NBRC 114555 / N2460) TaxID=522772 RepID=D4H8M3_DENA2|nr:hemin uptake protein HemP [Denitrovibrio acetiphilus]ADD68372.1 hypothetical protein Dacet_1606 [Denitrovibrio acetiphilus DSM 12809]